MLSAHMMTSVFFKEEQERDSASRWERSQAKGGLHWPALRKPLIATQKGQSQGALELSFPPKASEQDKLELFLISSDLLFPSLYLNLGEKIIYILRPKP